LGLPGEAADALEVLKARLDGAFGAEVQGRNLRLVGV